MLLLKNNEGNSFATASINSDELEGFFGIIKGMCNSKSNECNGLGFLHRMCEYITLQILKSDEFDIFSMKPELEAILNDD